MFILFTEPFFSFTIGPSIVEQGGRLGRPEKAKMREMDTNPNVIFPIGESGGASRNIIVAALHQFIYLI